MRKQEALRPRFFSTLPSVVSDEEKKKVDPNDEEVMLHSLSNHSGWQVLSDYMDQLTRELDGSLEHSMLTNASLEEIGRNAVVINLTKGIILRIKQKVQDARESIEKPI